MGLKKKGMKFKSNGEEGLFISIEGLDGVGKTTQIERLKQSLNQQGYSVITTQDPGGTELGLSLRSILKDTRVRSLSDEAELLLFYASRVQLMQETILPALEKRQIVISDRFADSSLAYQGYGRGIDIERIRRLHEILLRDRWPDLTFLLDCENDRWRRPSRSDRIEAESACFYQKVRAGFLQLLDRYPSRIIRIDAGQSMERVEQDIMKELGHALTRLF